MWLSEYLDLPDERWVNSFDIAFAAARQSLVELLAEASAADDLAIPHLVEGLVYPARSTHVCGYLAALFLSETALGERAKVEAQASKVLLREFDYVRVHGEAAIASLLMIANALEALGEPLKAGALITKASLGIAIANQPQSSSAIADPYHSIEEVLLSSVGGESPADSETFGGQSYTLHVLLEWFARRNYREVAAKLWPNITRIHSCEFCPTSPADLLAHHSQNGVMRTWAMPFPSSWGAIREEATVVGEDELPQRLWQHLEILPYLALLYPYRLTRATSKALDYLVSESEMCQIRFAGDPE
jgi:hypothetical protein